MYFLYCSWVLLFFSPHNYNKGEIPEKEVIKETLHYWDNCASKSSLDTVGDKWDTIMTAAKVNTP